MKYKILIMYVSAGSGHKSAAIALEEAFAHETNDVEVKVIDALDYTNPVYRNFYVSSYLNLVKHMPELWAYLYRTYDSRKISRNVERIRKMIDKFNAIRLTNFINKFKADAIIGTHFFPLQIVSRMKKQNKTKPLVFGVVTDYGAHSLWMQKNVDIYFVPTEEVMREMERFGQDGDKISVTGIPIKISFSQPKDIEKIKKTVGLDDKKATLLLMSGGYGIGPVKEFIRSFDKTKIPVQIIAVAGKNKKLANEIKDMKISIPVIVYEFANNMDELIAVSDFVATKPGGLTSTEVLAAKKPIIILDPIPGQEQRNTDYLLEHGVAIRLYNPEDAPFKIEQMMRDRNKLMLMQKNAEAISMPCAAINIVREVMKSLK